MEIKDKPNDSVASLYLVDAYMSWALLAAEEVIGKQGLHVLLREKGLERFIDNYPPEPLKISGRITLGDYAQLCAGLLAFFGRAGKSMVIRSGRLTSKYAIEKQSAVYSVAAKTAAKLLPWGMQVKLVLDSMANGYNKLYAENGQELHFSVEDRGDKWAFISVECPLCAGRGSCATSPAGASHTDTGCGGPVRDTSSRTPRLARSSRATALRVDRPPIGPSSSATYVAKFHT